VGGNILALAFLVQAQAPVAQAQALALLLALLVHARVSPYATACFGFMDRFLIVVFPDFGGEIQALALQLV
jgi:hypothetical protein